MSAATVLAGVAAGAAGGALTLMLHLVQHLAFGYTEDTFLTGVEQASSPRRVVALVIGGAVAGGGWWLLRRYTRPVIQVEAALRSPTRRLEIPTTTLDAVLQVTVVGLGASLGREGAPRQVGGALAEWLSRRLGLTPEQRRTLIGCGAGAGLAAVYNVPLGGAVFAAEVLLRSARPRIVVPALITSAVATVVAWTVLPDRATYSVPHYPLTVSLLVWALVAGPFFTAAGALFVRLTDLAAHAATGRLLALAPVPIFTALGALAIAYPQLLGNGKGPAQLAFTGGLGLATLGVLAALKPVATAAMLLSGARGGRLTPALATGALLGALLGGAWTHLWHGTDVGAFALAGAAAVLAVTLRAPLCAIVLTWEFTHAPLPLLVPMTLTVAAALATRSVVAQGLAGRTATGRRVKAGWWEHRADL